jgi:hypothetical protein
MTATEKPNGQVSAELDPFNPASLRIDPSGEVGVSNTK